MCRVAWEEQFTVQLTRRELIEVRRYFEKPHAGPPGCENNLSINYLLVKQEECYNTFT